ncbi:MAG: hypothetical protein ABIE36_03620 [Candidatus Diapherotrites archaeon]
MDEVKQENAGFTHKKKKLENIRENPWIASTFVLGVLILVLLLGNLSGITGKAISSEKAEQAILNFALAQGLDASVVSTEKNGDFYLVTLSMSGSEVPVYVTRDGKFLVQGLTPLISEEATTDTSSNTQTTTEVPKSDIPIVELFIWGYCPYGVQAQGPLAEVAALLGKYADFKAVMYYDGHGEYETQQNQIQECIQDLYPAKYWAYASGFVEDIYPACSSARTVDCDKIESVKLMKSLGIDSTKVLSCVDLRGEGLLSAASARAKELGVTGSPTLVVNSVKVNAARNAEAYKSAVCSAFNNAPEECATVLNSESGTASGNC